MVEALQKSSNWSIEDNLIRVQNYIKVKEEKAFLDEKFCQAEQVVDDLQKEISARILTKITQMVS